MVQREQDVCGIVVLVVVDVLVETGRERDRRTFGHNGPVVVGAVERSPSRLASDKPCSKTPPRPPDRSGGHNRALLQPVEIQATRSIGVTAPKW